MFKLLFIMKLTKYFFKKKNNSSLLNLKILFIIIMILSSLIAINSSSWFMMWMSMEMNLMSFIPLMMNSSKKIKISNSMMIYFIIQAMASSILIMIIIMMKLQNNIIKMNFLMNMMQLSLLMKLGASPFHWWTPKIFNNLSWMNCFMFLTWQKIIPLFLLMNFNNNFMIYISALTSSFMGAMLGINQISIKLIMNYSSINHLGWMLMTLMINKNLLLMYFMFYSLINLMISLIMNNYNFKFINQLFKNNNQNMNMKLIMMSMFLSLSGMPPMLGFLPKILTLMLMIKNNMIMETLMFIILSTISLSFYINILMSMFIFSKNNSKWMNKNNFNFNKTIFSILLLNLMLMLIIIIPLLNMLM
uniref:NADH-ubiquinone oxidoreductase chain 2 n=1 Tax=Tenthredo tienmushana TaxID=1385159 RepID=A0A0U2E431_9HYME|nr:NADH dehydrogenase subunit 2 [Tenthredo tienmushana]